MSYLKFFFVCAALAWLGGCGTEPGGYVGPAQGHVAVPSTVPMADPGAVLIQNEEEACTKKHHAKCVCGYVGVGRPFQCAVTGPAGY